MASSAKIKVVKITRRNQPARTAEPASFGFQAQRALHSAEYLPLAVAPTGDCPARWKSAGIRFTCDDGHAFIPGEGGALLSGNSAARDIILFWIFRNRLSLGGNVVLITGSEGDSSITSIGKTAARECGASIHEISSSYATPGFSPLAGWNEQAVSNFFCHTIAGEYTGQNAFPQDSVRQCYLAWKKLAQADDEARRLLMNGVYHIGEVLSCIESSSLSGQDQDRIADLMRSRSNECIQAAQIIGDYLRAFSGVCTNERGAARWHLFSPGLTVLRMTDQAARQTATVPWYLCRMAGYLPGRAGGNVAILVEDNVGVDILNHFSNILFDSSVCLLAVCGSYTGFADESMRTRFNSNIKQQYVFTQQEMNSASYWSQLSGERKVLLPSHTHTRGTTHSWFQPASKTRTDATTYTPTFRPVYEITYFTQMGDYEGELLENGSNGSFFHHFSISPKAR